MTNKYRKILEVNTKGRDFVIGDLHGCYDRLMTFLAFVSFDKEVDRIISVGDLADRGPMSYECYLLLNEPWFFAVQGNHEQMIADFLFGGPYAPFCIQNGGAWVSKYAYGENEAETRELARIARLSRELPLLLTVPMTNGKQFHIIHAELDSNYTMTDHDLEDQDLFEELAFEQTMDGDFIVWGRRLFSPWYGAAITPEAVAEYKEHYNKTELGVMFGPGLSHIYCGHSVVTQPLTIGGQTNLDTGAFYSYNPERNPWAGLTATEPLTGKFWITNSEGTKETTNVVI